MSEPKVIGVFKFSRLGPGIGSFYKLCPNEPTNSEVKYLYDDGSVSLARTRGFYIHIHTGFNFINRGPVHPDDWYWNDDEQRMIEVAALTEEEYLKVAMSDAIRITISEWHDNYIECATEAEARYNVNKISSPLKGGLNLHTR